MTNEVSTDVKASVPGQWGSEEINTLKNSVFKGLNDAEINYAGQVCKRTGLDPFLKQIYFVKRKDKFGRFSVTNQTGIDGFRLQAQRSGEYAGSDDAIFDNEDKPNRASVTIYRIVKGVRCSFTATARWAEYYPGDGPQGTMWRKMPCTMLGKCAEALALRKAFPGELSGLYTTEEMQQANTDQKPVKSTFLQQPQEDEIDDAPGKVPVVNAPPKPVKEEPIRDIEIIEEEDVPMFDDFKPEPVKKAPVKKIKKEPEILGGKFVLPFGKLKGTPIEQLEQDQIDSIIGWFQNMSEPPKGVAMELLINLQEFIGQQIEIG